MSNQMELAVSGFIANWWLPSISRRTWKMLKELMQRLKRQLPHLSVQRADNRGRP